MASGGPPEDVVEQEHPEKEGSKEDEDDQDSLATLIARTSVEPPDQSNYYVPVREWYELLIETAIQSGDFDYVGVLKYMFDANEGQLNARSLYGLYNHYWLTHEDPLPYPYGEILENCMMETVQFYVRRGSPGNGPVVPEHPMLERTYDQIREVARQQGEPANYRQTFELEIGHRTVRFVEGQLDLSQLAYDPTRDDPFGITRYLNAESIDENLTQTNSLTKRMEQNIRDIYQHTVHTRTLIRAWATLVGICEETRKYARKVWGSEMRSQKVPKTTWEQTKHLLLSPDTRRLADKIEGLDNEIRAILTLIPQSHWNENLSYYARQYIEDERFVAFLNMARKQEFEAHKALPRKKRFGKKAIETVVRPEKGQEKDSKRAQQKPNEEGSDSSSSSDDEFVDASPEFMWKRGKAPAKGNKPNQEKVTDRTNPHGSHSSVSAQFGRLNLQDDQDHQQDPLDQNESRSHVRWSTNDGLGQGKIRTDTGEGPSSGGQQVGYTQDTSGPFGLNTTYTVQPSMGMPYPWYTPVRNNHSGGPGPSIGMNSSFPSMTPFDPSSRNWGTTLTKTGNAGYDTGNGSYRQMSSGSGKAQDAPHFSTPQAGGVTGPVGGMRTSASYATGHHGQNQGSDLTSGNPSIRDSRIPSVPFGGQSGPMPQASLHPSGGVSAFAPTQVAAGQQGIVPTMGAMGPYAGGLPTAALPWAQPTMSLHMMRQRQLDRLQQHWMDSRRQENIPLVRNQSEIDAYQTGLALTAKANPSKLKAIREWIGSYELSNVHSINQFAGRVQQMMTNTDIHPSDLDAVLTDCMRQHEQARIWYRTWKGIHPAVREPFDAAFAQQFLPYVSAAEIQRRCQQFRPDFSQDIIANGHRLREEIRPYVELIKNPIEFAQAEEELLYTFRSIIGPTHCLHLSMSGALNIDQAIAVIENYLMLEPWDDLIIPSDYRHPLDGPGKENNRKAASMNPITTQSSVPVTVVEVEASNQPPVTRDSKVDNPTINNNSQSDKQLGYRSAYYCEFCKINEHTQARCRAYARSIGREVPEAYPCKKCGRKGEHWEDNCPQGGPRKLGGWSSTMESPKCYNCQGYGHLAKDCSSPKRQKGESNGRGGNSSAGNSSSQGN